MPIGISKKLSKNHESMKLNDSALPPEIESFSYDSERIGKLIASDEHQTIRVIFICL